MCFVRVFFFNFYMIIVIISRYGIFEELKEMIDVVYVNGITVLLDVVYSYVFKNVVDGLNKFDGINFCYFYDGSRGINDLWDLRFFNYIEYDFWVVLFFRL